ncbi:leucocin A/sakacin P family class II bacteriocin [Streptococcus ferus]|uniref:leucocin A/sakacin P family class II bacteriocin n=1 Tax=Streptococcus ferus TaxID=1345 RepID=UPI0023562AAA|nr:leucocin A/sakacin P family class II bacteriocin [Streptococcus ferus]
MKTLSIAQFEVLDAATLEKTKGGKKVVSIGNGIYCYDGTSKCWSNSSEIWGATGKVIVNGWVNYGPWAPRPGIGIVVP